MAATTGAPPRPSAVSPADQDFAARCAQPDVVKCVGFDDAADFSTGNGGTQGAYGANAGILPSGTDYSRAVRDVGISASGGSSLPHSAQWFLSFMN